MTATGYVVRPSLTSDLGALAAIELAANRLFPPGALPPEVQGQPLPPAMLLRGQQEGWLWVAASADGDTVGFALGAGVDEELALLLEIDVHPDHGRRGLGAALIDSLATSALARGYRQLGLITFDHLPWNAPMYERLGFVRCQGDTVPPLLRQALDDDAARGFAQRVAMSLDLTRPLRLKDLT